MSTQLSTAYAQILREKGHEPGFLKHVAAFMKSRGHVSLVPSIARILARDPMSKRARVYVARETDAKKYAGDIRSSLQSIGESDAETVIDPNAVGGFLVVGRSKAIDRTFRSALVKIYQNTVS